MDYTLCEYKSPEYDQLSYNLAIEGLLAKGYPSSVVNLRFDPAFPIRGLFLDKQFGNLLKVEQYGEILVAVHGKRKLTREEVRRIYPSSMIHTDDIGSRFYVCDTLFTISEACLYSDLVEHLEDLHRKSAPTPSPSGQREAINVSAGEADGFQLSFFNLFEDVRATFHQMHIDGSLQRATLANLDKYVKRSNELPTLLRRLRSHGKATFLLTNSSWDYTDRIMSYLIDDIGAGRWVDLFAVVFVNASKPSFFEKGSTLREVDPATGLLRLTRVDVQGGRLGRVFQGGNLSQLEKILGSKGGDVLYVGDHIFGDVLRSRTSKGLWRTLLVVPELARELEAWRKAYVGGKNSESLLPSNLHPLLTHMDKATDDFDCTFNGWFGSLFRRGPKTTFFGMQTARYADLYSSTCLNLLNYPMFYLFSPMVQLLVHEEHLIERIETYTASPMKSPQKSDEDE